MRYWKPRVISGNTVGIVITSYLGDDPRRVSSLMCLLWALKAQTYPHWVAKIAHDGPLDPQLKKCFLEVDSRVSVVEFDRLKHHGHPHRRVAALSDTWCDVREKPTWILMTNDDNYYAPAFLEWLVSEGEAQRSDIVYCNMVHSHKLWAPFRTELSRGKIDIGSFLVRRTLVEKVPWTDFSFSGDGAYVEALAVQAKRTTKIEATLFTHN